MAETDKLTLQIHTSIHGIDAAAWDACAGSDNPFVSHAFLSALEDSGSTDRKTGWLSRHTSLQDDAGRILAVAPMYAKLHSYGEYVFDHGWAEAYQRAGGRYYPKLQIGVPFSPVPGPRLLRRPDSATSTAAVADALRDVCEKLEMSSVHVTFCSEDEWGQLGETGWLQRLGTQFHWHNQGYATFDDFLAALSSKHRKSIRRERRDANAVGLVFETLRGDDIKPHHWDAFYRFYQATIDRKWGEAYLTREFFALLSERLNDRVVLMIATHEGVPVAGALNLLGSETLYGRNWGCVGQWPFLHFELCYYRALDFAIEHGLKRVEAGAQGEHKILRGYLPQLTYSAHFLSNPSLSRAVQNFLTQESDGVKRSIQHMAGFSPYRQNVSDSK